MASSPADLYPFNQWRERDIHAYQQFQRAISSLSIYDQSIVPLSQHLPFSTEAYAELDSIYPQNQIHLPRCHLLQGDISQELLGSDDREQLIIAIEAKQQRSLRRLQAAQAGADYNQKLAKYWQELAKDHQETIALEKAHLQRLALELEDAQTSCEHRSQGGNYNRKNSSHNNRDSTSSQQQQPDKTKVPDFMKEYLSGRPEAAEPPAGEEPDVKRCSVGRPIGKKLEKGTIYYQIGRCDKHSNKTVFKDNMNMQVEGQDGYRLVEHAWKCSGQATLRPLETQEVQHRE